MTANEDTDADLGQRAEREIVDLEAFLEGWISGQLDNSVRTFDRFADVLAPRFHIVPPAGMGEELNRAELIGYMVRQRDTDRATTRWVENILIGHVDDSSVIAVCDECQVRNGVRLNSRVSVTFIAADGTPNGLAWAHIHETVMPDDLDHLDHLDHPN